MVYEKKYDYKESLMGIIPRNAESFVFGILRITLGWVWLWAFFDKLFGLGFATTPEKAWINGNSPISGFLKFGTNPESPFYLFFSNDLIQFSVIMDIVLMGMFLFVGLGLIFGIMVRISSIGGIIFMIAVYLAEIPLTNNPIIDEHIIYALILALFFVSPNVGKYLGLGSKWHSYAIVQKYPLLK